MQQPFRAFRIRNEGGEHAAGVESVQLADLADGELDLKVAWSSVNFKDGLAGTGKGKICRSYPMVGGIDVAGHVVASRDDRFREGDAVLLTGSGLSETRDGGYSEYARVQAEWAVPLPSGLSMREAMGIGTAGNDGRGQDDQGGQYNDSECDDDGYHVGLMFNILLRRRTRSAKRQHRTVGGSVCTPMGPGNCITVPHTRRLTLS